MAAWPEERLTTWRDFSEWYDRRSEWMRAGGMMICRGQADSRWGLRPSLGRILAEQSISRDDALFREQQAMWAFQEQAHLHFGRTPAAAGDLLSWWGLMQHYRAPTRILDWTASPYVALYFAVEDLFGCDGAVWVLDAEGLRSQMAILFDGWTFPSSFDEFAGMLSHTQDACRAFDFALAEPTQRMVAQQGRFTVCTDIFADHAEAIPSLVQQSMSLPGLYEHKEFPAGVCQRVVIDGSHKPEFLWHLRKMNVTASSLFPGADGVGRSVREFLISKADPAWAERFWASRMSQEDQE